MASNTARMSRDDGHLVKAQCGLCGEKFGSIEEAKQCERKHMNEILRKSGDNLWMIN